MLHRFEDRDRWGIPRHIWKEGSSDTPRFPIQEDIVIVRAEVDPVFPEDVFAWKPPPTYLIADYRGGGPPTMYRAEELREPK